MSTTLIYVLKVVVLAFEIHAAEVLRYSAGLNLSIKTLYIGEL